MALRSVTLYRSPTSACDVDRIGDWLAARIDATVHVRDRFLAVHGVQPQLATAFADARVISPYDRATGSRMLGVRRYEERALKEPERAGGVLYDGLAIQRALNEALPPRTRTLDELHVAVLDRIVATWGDHDGRWHKRIAVLGQPAILSVPGLYEAPAKPEAYYREQHRHAIMTGDAPPRELLEHALDLEMLVADDPRTTDAMQGYALKAYDYLATGEGFCEVAYCRLANPHRHPDLIEAQLEVPAFCERHDAIYGVTESVDA